MRSPLDAAGAREAARSERESRGPSPTNRGRPANRFFDEAGAPSPSVQESKASQPSQEKRVIGMSALKWWILFGALAVCWPLGRLVATRPRVQTALVWCAGFVPFIGLSHVTMNPISFETYRGDARGLEVTLVDILMLVLAFALPRRTQPAPYRWSRLAYLSIVALSVLLAPMPHFAFFGLWKVLRLYLFVSVLARAFEDWKLASTWLKGLAWGTVYALAIGLEQRYLGHQHQVASTFPHQNTLGMAICLIAPVTLAITLAGQGGKTAWASLGAMSVLLVLALSRGALLAFLLGAGIVYAGSLLRGVTPRKLLAGAAALAAFAVVLVKAAGTILERFLMAPKESSQIRASFESISAAMLRDHPFGVGINQYSWVLEHSAYSRDLPPNDKAGIVHNLYWLTAAELGFAGIVAFAALMAVPIVLAVRGAFLARRDVRGDVLLGCFGGMVALSALSVLEWVARQTVMGYMYWGLAALVFALHRHISVESSPR